MRSKLIILWICIIQLSYGSDHPPKLIGNFFKTYCISCHGPKKQKADFRVDTLTISKNAADAESWQLILDNLHLGEMPPEKKAQPSIAEYEKVTAWIESELERAKKALKGHTGEVVLRRLNRLEYENTIEDLFGVKGYFTESFPEDLEEEGFKNNGAALMLSSTQLEEYMKSSDYVLDKVFTAKRNTNSKKMDYTLFDEVRSEEKRFKKYLVNFQKRYSKLSPEDKKKADDLKKKLSKKVYESSIYLTLENGAIRLANTNDGLNQTALMHRHTPYPDTKNFFRVTQAGWYTFKLKAFSYKSKKPLRVKILSGKYYNGATPELVDVLEVGAEKGKVYTYKIYLHNGESVRIHLMDYIRIKNDEDPLTHPGPFLAVNSLSLEGPHPQPEPPAQKYIHAGINSLEKSEQDLDQNFRNLLGLLHRRPATSEKLNRYKSLFLHFKKNLSAKEAYRKTIQAMMLSTEFLYLVEKDDSLDGFEMASRLSYFLWRSVPDKELLEAAGKGDLRKKSTYTQQVLRMMNDDKFERFILDFTHQWLGIDKVGEINPDSKLYPEYDQALKFAMKKETELFIAEIIKNNLKIETLINANWSFLNSRVARHYGVSGVTGSHFRKVNFNGLNTIRGGILTQASIHNITSNGTTTSPVNRGVWVLEKVLGLRVPPPPPDVPAIEPDIRGATTIKEQLKKHREIEQCSSCHRKIDPYGMALENFDVLGGWRQNYRTLKKKKGRKNANLSEGPAVDSSGELPRAESFKGFAEFKKIIAEKKELIYENTAHKLLTFSLGRSLEFSDRQNLKVIVEKTVSRGGGFKDLILSLVTNSVFFKP